MKRRVVAGAGHMHRRDVPSSSPLSGGSAETYAGKAAFGGKVALAVGRRKGGRLRSIFSRELSLFLCLMANPACFGLEK